MKKNFMYFYHENFVEKLQPKFSLFFYINCFKNNVKLS